MLLIVYLCNINSQYSRIPIALPMFFLWYDKSLRNCIALGTEIVDL
jgi:hypothetical protein